MLGWARDISLWFVVSGVVAGRCGGLLSAIRRLMRGCILMLAFLPVLLVSGLFFGRGVVVLGGRLVCFWCGAVAGGCGFVLVGSWGLVVVGDGVLVGVGCISITVGLVSTWSLRCYLFLGFPVGLLIWFMFWPVACDQVLVFVLISYFFLWMRFGVDVGLFCCCCWGMRCIWRGWWDLGGLLRVSLWRCCLGMPFPGGWGLHAVCIRIALELPVFGRGSLVGWISWVAWVVLCLF
mmetsp:Transcript_11934/g.18211  ORF Transcript_11934/g.18211 Transcript_11934/m.18211 type:complete len:235 (+) Transcript_11934:81-785(+)